MKAYINRLRSVGMLATTIRSRLVRFFFPLLFVPILFAVDEVKPGRLVVSNLGLNALQVVDPVTLTVVQTIPIPAPYHIDNDLHTVLVRNRDRALFANVRNGSLNYLIVMDKTGQLLAAQSINDYYANVCCLQQLVFDPIDKRQNTVLGGIPNWPAVVAIRPFDQFPATRVRQKAVSGTPTLSDSRWTSG